MQYPVRVGPIVNDQATFTPDMVLGWHPDAPRLFSTRNRGGVQINQAATHVSAPFGPEMVAGWHPDRNRAFVAPKPGWSVSQTTHVAAPFGPEMVQGWHSDTNRAFRPPRLGLQISQTTHVSAPFSVEMIVGQRPSARRYLARHTSDTVWDLTVAAVVTSTYYPIRIYGD